MRTLWIGLIALLGASWVRAQPLADHVPGDSMLYVAWTGFDNPPRGYEGSHLQSLLAHSHIREVFSDFVPKLARRASIVDPNIGANIDLALNILAPMLRHPSALYVERVEIVHDDPAIGSGFVCQAGTDAAELEKRLAVLKSKLGSSEWFSWKRDGEIISIQLGLLPSQTTDTIGKSAELTTALKYLPPDAPLMLHVNIGRMLATADAIIAQANQPQITNYWPKVRDALGIDGLKSLTWCSHFEGKDWMDEVFVAAPAPRHGLLTIKEASGPLADDALAPVPATANLVAATTLDLGKALTAIHDSANAVDPQFGHLMDQGLGGLTIFIGRNFQRDVVEPFGPQWVLYTDPARSGNGIVGLTLVNRPNDLRKADGALTAMAIAISNTSAGLLRQYGFSVPLERTKFGEQMMSYLGLPLLSPSWTTSGDRLYAAILPQVAASAAKAAAAGKSIKDDESFKAAIARLKVDKPTSLAYTDFRIGAAESYQSLMILSRLVFGAADAWGVKAPEPVLPAYEDLIAELSPASAAGWIDDAGFHYKSINPFPCCEVLSSGNSFALLNAAATFSGGIAPMVAQQRRNPYEMAPTRPEPQIP